MASSSSSSGHSTILCSLLLTAMLMMPLPSPTIAQLTTGFYATTCPNAFDIIRAGVRSAVNREARMGASLLRLFFHDCFVNGCDAGVLIDGADGEQAAAPNVNSLRGFNVISSIKAQLNTACGNVVSCADVLAVAARDSVVELGGPTYQVPVGRRDARTSSQSGANNELPGFSDDLATLTNTFTNKGFTQRDLVALSGAHTIGFAQCATFRDRIYNDTNIDPTFATARRANCPSNGGNTNLAPLDAQSPNRFGNNYFQALMSKRGLLHSDQVLFDGGATDSIVRSYSTDANAFNTDFGSAMVKMGNLSPLTGTQGEIRTVCNKIN